MEDLKLEGSSAHWGYMFWSQIEKHFDNESIFPEVINVEFRAIDRSVFDWNRFLDWLFHMFPKMERLTIRQSWNEWKSMYDALQKYGERLRFFSIQDSDCFIPDLCQKDLYDDDDVNADSNFVEWKDGMDESLRMLCYFSEKAKKRAHVFSDDMCSLMSNKESSLWQFHLGACYSCDKDIEQFTQPDEKRLLLELPRNVQKRCEIWCYTGVHHNIVFHQ